MDTLNHYFFDNELHTACQLSTNLLGLGSDLRDNLRKDEIVDTSITRTPCSFYYTFF